MPTKGLVPSKPSVSGLEPGIVFVLPAGDGLLLPVLWDRHVSGVHWGGARRTPHSPPQGCGGAAQGLTPGPVGRRQQKVHTPPPGSPLAVMHEAWPPYLLSPWVHAI